jgi:uncharacterized protein (TIGR02217 family)
MAVLDDVRFPDRIGLGAEGGPTFATVITTSTGGHEQRQANWAEARRRYNVATGLKGRADVEALLAFYSVRRSQLRGLPPCVAAFRRSSREMVDGARHG